MSVHTKTRRTSITRKKAVSPYSKKKVRSIPWREASKSDIKKYTETGLMVRGARFKAELTQKQLAEKLGVLPHHISEMEYGKRPISKKMAHKLSEALNVNYKVFL
jgi:ribosome-binding protein aMBF1 (putative translation factor)